MAVQAARECCLDIAGVDMILTQDQGPMILEVNYSPGFRGLETATGMNIAKIILDSGPLPFLKRQKAGRAKGKTYEVTGFQLLNRMRIVLSPAYA